MAFVKTSGTDFTINGQKWTPFGGTTYDISGTHAAVDDKISRALALNLNLIRIVNFFGANQGFNEATWAQADYILDQCRQLGLKVLLDLSDHQGVLDGEGRVFGDATSLSRWNAFVSWLFPRVNTINGRIYKDDDTIAIVAIVGEAEGYSGTTGYDTFNTIAGYIKAIDTNHIIHPGGMKPELIVPVSYGLGVQPPQDILSAPNIDCASTHPYYTQPDMLHLFPYLQRYSQEKNKPWFIEEFGYNQSNSAMRHDKTRAQALRFVYDLGLKYGSAGFIFWNIDGGFYNEQTHTGGGYGISPNTPECFNMVRQYTKYTRYSPRIPVDSTQYGGS